MLEPGDKFKMLGSIYEVKRIVGGSEKGKIWKCPRFVRG